LPIEHANAVSSRSCSELERRIDMAEVNGRPFVNNVSLGVYGGSGAAIGLVGVDGEAVTLLAPIRCATRPSALRVRISRRHPGLSPSALGAR
jgi:diacylglycerol kinase family enzyme